MEKYIAIKNISYKYKNGRPVLKNLSLDIKGDEITFLTGKNGSGKTTLTKLIMGILNPQSGSISISGVDNKNLTLGQVGDLIGYVFQFPERQLFAMSVMEELTFPLLLKGQDNQSVNTKAEDLIKLFELDKVKASYPFLLSYGEKRRLAIAAVLMNNPKYLILDEPTASLDQDRIQILSGILKELKRQGIGMLIISHNQDLILKHADRLINIDEGKIIRDGKR